MEGANFEILQTNSIENFTLFHFQVQNYYQLSLSSSLELGCIDDCITTSG